MQYFTRTSETIFGQTTYIVRENNDEYAHIPISEENIDYLQYLEWLAQGNTAEEWTPE
jgi:hypothetical protein